MRQADSRPLANWKYAVRESRLEHTEEAPVPDARFGRTENLLARERSRAGCNNVR